MFHVTTDPARKLLEISFESFFWDMETAIRFRDACVQGVASLRCTPGTYLVLVDLRRSVLQSQAIIDWLLEMVRNSAAARMALVADSPLSRMQTRRLQIRDNVRMFDGMEEAREWLFASAVAEARAA